MSSLILVSNETPSQWRPVELSDYKGFQASGNLLPYGARRPTKHNTITRTNKTSANKDDSYNWWLTHPTQALLSKWLIQLNWYQSSGLEWVSMTHFVAEGSMLWHVILATELITWLQIPYLESIPIAIPYFGLMVARENMVTTQLNLKLEMEQKVYKEASGQSSAASFSLASFSKAFCPQLWTSLESILSSSSSFVSVYTYLA